MKCLIDIDGCKNNPQEDDKADVGRSINHEHFLDCFWPYHYYLPFLKKGSKFEQSQIAFCVTIREKD